MKHISIWAKQHKTSARWFIVFLYLPLNILAIYNGMLLSGIELQLGSSFFYITVLCILLLFLLYRSNASYYQRKSMHFLMAACTYFLILFLGNQVNTPKPQFPFFETVNAVEQVPLLHKENNRGVDNFNPSVVKQHKKELRKIARNETKKPPQWVKILLTVLVIVVAAGLMYVLAALACTIACNGSEALAWIVFLAGSAGIVFGAVRIIQWIFGRKRKKRKQEANAN